MGTQTRPVPTAGSNEKKPIITPQSSEPSIPSSEKITPPTRPCATATTTVPFIVARTTITKLLTSRSRKCGRKGMASRINRP